MGTFGGRKPQYTRAEVSDRPTWRANLTKKMLGLPKRCRKPHPKRKDRQG